MPTNPLFTALGAAGVIFFSKFAALAASVPVDSIPINTDWPALIEKAGTIGVLVWMVMWFQKRLEAKDAVVQQLTEKLVKAVSDTAEANTAIAKSISDLPHERR